MYIDMSSKIAIRKLGWVYKPKGDQHWSISHAQVPFAFDLNNGKIRVYFSTRDELGRSGVSFIEVSRENPTQVEYVHDALCLKHGGAGMFDETGAMPSWFIQKDQSVFLYYTGWNRSESAAYRLAIGLAESTDSGLTFQRVFTGPVLDRGIQDQVWVGQPCVLIDNGIWRMWYLSCSKIEMINGRPEPFYNVRYAESYDGIKWDRHEKTCIDFNSNTDAIGRPCVWYYGGLYYMLHSNRKANGYREDPKAGYRICLSVSKNGVDWEQNPDFIVPKDTSWETIMNEYTSILPTSVEGKFLVFYNGDGFGAAGFGVMELTIEK
jgi:hypothetical protein